MPFSLPSSPSSLPFLFKHYITHSKQFVHLINAIMELAMRQEDAHAMLGGWATNAASVFLVIMALTVYVCFYLFLFFSVIKYYLLFISL
jgi:hypothetical protein